MRWCDDAESWSWRFRYLYAAAASCECDDADDPLIGLMHADDDDSFGVVDLKPAWLELHDSDEWKPNAEWVPFSLPESMPESEGDSRMRKRRASLLNKLAPAAGDCVVVLVVFVALQLLLEVVQSIRS